MDCHRSCGRQAQVVVEDRPDTIPPHVAEHVAAVAGQFDRTTFQALCHTCAGDLSEWDSATPIITPQEAPAGLTTLARAG